MNAENGEWSAAPLPVTGAGRAPLGPGASADDGAVVAMGALCDVAVPWNQLTREISFALTEYLELESGIQVVLHSERGITIGVRGDSHLSLTAGELRELLLGALLPDEGEEPGEPHPWRWLAERAARYGIRVTPEDLKSLRYEFDFQPAVQALIRSD